VTEVANLRVRGQNGTTAERVAEKHRFSRSGTLPGAPTPARHSPRQGARPARPVKVVQPQPKLHVYERLLA
jgi:hypothetical protein